MNTARAPFDNVSLRKAVNWAIDRPAQVRLLGTYAGTRTDQILVPGIPGYKPYNVYALKGANVAKAKQVGGAAIASAPTLNVVHTTSAYSTNRAQVAEFNLKQVGFKINDVPTPATNYYQVIQTKGTIVQLRHQRRLVRRLLRPVRLPERAVRRPQDPGREQQQLHVLQRLRRFNKRPRHAAALSGAARAAAYAKLDQQLMVKYAPCGAVPDRDEPVLRQSHATKNWIYSSYFGAPYFNALAVG